MSEAANSLIQATVAHLSQFAPFDQMQSEHLLWLAQKLTLRYFAKGEVILTPGAADTVRFFVIKQGVVQGDQRVTQSLKDSAWLELHEGECFPLGALLANRPVTSTYRASSDVFSYELPAADFLQLTRLSEAFNDFCTRRIANLLEQSQLAIQAEYATGENPETSFSYPLEKLIHRLPVSVCPGTSLSTALELMSRERVGSVAVIDANEKPLGILTLRDVLNRVALAGLAMNTPIESVMTANPCSLPATAPASEALLVLAQQGIHHLLVTRDERLIGVISEKNLFALRRLSIEGVTAAIQHAATLPDLIGIAPDIQALAKNLIAQGLHAEVLTRIISSLNDHLSCRAIELEAASVDLTGVTWCWIALGSEGRREQTLSSDQDNALIFFSDQPAETIRNRLLSLAGRINNALAECGFPLCKGEIMASNPKWCLSDEEWRATFANWIQRGDGVALLHASIFFDLRALYGATGLCDDLRSWLNDAIQSNPLFLKLMVENALANHPPLGLVRDFVVSSGDGQAHTLDLKINGVTPFVDAARIFALHAGINTSGTTERLREAGNCWKVRSSEVEAWVAAFHYIQLLRLRHQHAAQQKGDALTNRIDPGLLDNLDRRILKEAFRQARKLQSRMSTYFEF